MLMQCTYIQFIYFTIRKCMINSNGILIFYLSQVRTQLIFFRLYPGLKISIHFYFRSGVGFNWHTPYTCGEYL